MVECQLPKLKVAGSTPVSRSNSPSATPPTDGKQARVPVEDVNAPEGLTSLGRTITITGEVVAGEHLIIEGRVEGTVSAPDHGVAIARRASVAADVSAKTITVLGRVSGRLNASGTLHVEMGGVVEGSVEAADVTLADGAHVDLPGPTDERARASLGVNTPHRRASGE